ncbi:MAG TPA: DUF4142 domain-containing protein [Polyangiaceae bacterium]|jgi:hypothetical protein
MSHSTPVSRTTLLAVTLVLCLAACDRREGSTSQQSTASPTSELAPGGVSAEPASGGASGAASNQAANTDATPFATMDLAGQAVVLRAIDHRILKEAQLAERASTNADIKRVAHELHRLHRDEISTEQAIFARMHIRPASNEVSRQIDADTDRQLQALRGLGGPQFDTAFLDDEVRAHAQGVDDVDRMFPSVKGSELQAEVLRSRTGLTAYLVTLTDLQKNIGVAQMQGSGSSAGKPRP